MKLQGVIMNASVTVGKREFIQHTSKYLKLVERYGEITISHQNHPALRIMPIKEKRVKDLRGLVQTIKVHGDINDHVVPEMY